MGKYAYAFVYMGLTRMLWEGGDGERADVP